MLRLKLILITLLLNVNLSNAQDNSLSKEYKETVIQKLSQLIVDFYVFPEVAELTKEHLKNQLLEGYFDQFKENESFASALTKSVQSINNDKHMRIRADLLNEKTEKKKKIEEYITRIDRSREGNSGFKTVKILDGNVGYIDIRGFAGIESGKKTTDAYMKLISRTDAIIIDLRNNGGGSPRMVQYLCSYFFNQKLHLNSLYWRENDTTEEFWTLDQVGGSKLDNVPLFILTSKNTFSGAEEFSYNMQTQKRATLIGQTTRGGANPGRNMRINSNLRVFIPTGKAINPITNTNWEGVGVKPDIETKVDDAYNKALSIAQKAAGDYRAQRNKKFDLLFSNLIKQLNDYNNENSDNIILENLKKCKNANLLNEGDINNLGYEYLIKYKKSKIAESILKANTILYKNSANVFDSYAELLMINGDIENSIKNYQHAIDIATLNKDNDLKFYQNNLEKVKQNLNNKKK